MSMRVEVVDAELLRLPVGSVRAYLIVWWPVWILMLPVIALGTNLPLVATLKSNPVRSL